MGWGGARAFGEYWSFNAVAALVEQCIASCKEEELDAVDRAQDQRLLAKQSGAGDAEYQHRRIGAKRCDYRGPPTHAAHLCLGSNRRLAR